MDLSWYNSLSKPFFIPPSWVFGPIWVVIYALIAISAYSIFSKWKRNRDYYSAFKFFVIQLILNLLWSPIFFGFHLIFLALIDIVLMLIFIYLTIQSFYKINKTSASLLWIYFIWVVFALVLNYSVWVLNR